MTTTVLMKKTCVAGNGTFHTAGQTYALDDAIAGAYLASQSATFVSGGQANQRPVMAEVNDLTGGIRKVSAGSASVPVVLDFGNSLAMLGDSWTPPASVFSGVTPGYVDYEWILWAKAKAQSRIRVVLNAGVTGERTDQIYARVQSVIDSGCTVCTVLAGKNDISQDIPGATILTNLGLIYKALTDNGIKVVACTVPPYQTGYALISAARTAVENVVNDGIRRRCLTNPLLRLADIAADILNASSSPTVTKTNYLRTDNLHLSSLGSRKIGENSIYQALIAEFDAVNQLPISIADTANVTAGNSNIIANPLFQGTAGGKSAGTGTINAGNVADGYNLEINAGTATVTPSQSARADGFGNDQVFTIVSASASDSIRMYTAASVHGLVTSGDKIKAMCQLSVTGMTNVTGIEMYLSIIVSGQQYFVRAMSKSSTTFDQTDFTDYVFETHEFEIPAGAVTLLTMYTRIYFGGVGGAVMKVSRSAVRKL